MSGCINLSMMSVNSDSKLFICSDCFSISFPSLETLPVLGKVGELFWGGSLWLFGVFRVPCGIGLGHRRLREW